MYRLRIHTVDVPHYPPPPLEPPPAAPSPSLIAAAEASPSTSSSSSLPPAPLAATTTARTYRILESKGIVHLYRKPSPRLSSSAPSDPFPFPILPLARGVRLLLLAVPSSLSVDDLLKFCSTSHSENFSEIQVIRNDGVEDRYSVLVQLDDQKSADNFYLNVNGWRFPSAKEEICHVLFLDSVEYTGSTDVLNTPLLGFTELPTCPVCLERLDQDTSGINTTGCDHSFKCSCISKWENSSCLVCRFCQEHSDKPICSICGTSENLWSCMICGFVGCGRYKEGHAFRHWKDTQHCYSLDLATQRVWDYVGDTYVHRLNQSKSDEKIVKLKNVCRTADGTYGTSEYSEDVGIGGALYSSKVDAIMDEYNRLLTSQLENQRQYYESLVMEAKGKREKLISESVENALNLKLQSIQLEFEKTTEDTKRISEVNAELTKNQNKLKEKLKETEEREKATLRSKDGKIRDLEDEIRDFSVYIEAQKALANRADADDLKGGTVLPVPPQQPSSSNFKKGSKGTRRRH